MGGRRRHNSPIGAQSPRVCFAEGDVTGELRPLTNNEHWTLYYFESHAAGCRSCHNPLRVSKQGRRLCDIGHELAIEVAGIISRDRYGKIHSRQESHRDIRLEIPPDYDETVGLLRAIQREVKKGHHFLKPKSHDRSYPVRNRRSRSPERFATTPEPYIWHHSRHDDPLRSFAELDRGSHYYADMGDLQKARRNEQRVEYNVELRVPNYFQTSRRSAYI